MACLKRAASCRLRWTTLASAVSLYAGESAASGAVEFDSAFLQRGGVAEGDAHDPGLSAIANGASVAPGTYTVTVRVNGTVMDRQAVRVASNTDGEMSACLTRSQVEGFGLKPAVQDALANGTDGCIDLPRSIDGATVSLDAATMALDVSLPQVALQADALGYVDPSRWDSGINAAMVNYSAAAGQSRSRGATTSRLDLYLNGGVNLGAWRLRANGTANVSNDGERNWASSYRYAQRDLPKDYGQVTLGESFTPGDVFPTVAVLGAQVSSNLSMQPDSRQGYAPVIRGVAESRAKVEVRQNGYPIYTTYVAPGPFEITDLTAAGGNGDLEIVVTEADGRIRKTVQPYAAAPNMLRQGVWTYNATAGRYNGKGAIDKPDFVQWNVGRGFDYGTTLYGGMQASRDYRAASLGIGKSLGRLGALSGDVTWSRSKDLLRGHSSGSSVRVQYGKAFATGTNLRFASARYSSEGYRTFEESIGLANGRDWGGRRSEFTANVAQTLGTRGSLYLTYNQRTYWGKPTGSKDLQAGLSMQFRHATAGLFVSRTRSQQGHAYNSGSLTLTIPLDAPRGTVGYTASSDSGQLAHRASLSGWAGGERSTSYSASATRSERNGTSAAGNLGGQSSWGQWGAGADVGRHRLNGSVSAQGSVLVHGDGVVFGPTLGETVALVEVPNTAGVGLNEHTAAATNAKGFAVLPYLRPYRRNRVSLDTTNTPDGLEFKEGIQSVVPRQGAVVRARFEATRSDKLVLMGSQANGEPLPFGASVTTPDGTALGLVGQGGQIVVDRAHATSLKVTWGAGAAAASCELAATDTVGEPSSGYSIASARCRVPLGGDSSFASAPAVPASTAAPSTRPLPEHPRTSVTAEREEPVKLATAAAKKNAPATPPSGGTVLATRPRRPPGSHPSLASTSKTTVGTSSRNVPTLGGKAPATALAKAPARPATSAKARRAIAPAKAVPATAVRPEVWVVEARLPDRSKPPFGTYAYDSTLRLVGVVGHDGHTLLNLRDSREITLRWGNRDEERCHLVVGKKTAADNGVHRSTLECRPSRLGMSDGAGAVAERALETQSGSQWRVALH